MTSARRWGRRLGLRQGKLLDFAGPAAGGPACPGTRKGRELAVDLPVNLEIFIDYT